MYYYVDTQEMCREPKDGAQWTIWFTGSSQNNRKGREYTDLIKGEEVHIRAMDEQVLKDFLKKSYTRAPWLKVYQVAEYKGDE